jgi:hypothetical protein
MFTVSMTQMPMPPDENLEMRKTGGKTEILGLACECYEIKQSGETMEIWATGQLLPFRPYVASHSSPFGPRRIEDQWPELLKSRKLFPLRAVLRFDNGVQRLRFEVKSVTPGKPAEEYGKLFRPPAEFTEMRAPRF